MDKEEQKLVAFYFPHDIGASNDPKLVDLRMSFGWKSIGMYWAIIEALHKEKEGKLPIRIITSMILDFYCQEEIRISQHIKEEAKEFEKVLYANALLIKQKGYATANRVQKNLLHRKIKSEKARESALSRWSKTAVISQEKDDMRTHSEHNANAMLVKERKGKERKGYILSLALTHWNKRNVWPSTSPTPQNGLVVDKLLPKCFKETSDLKTEWNKIAPTQQEWEDAVKAYVLEIANRNPDNDYAKHRFSFYEFIKQKNGYTKFLNR